MKGWRMHVSATWLSAWKRRLGRLRNLYRDPLPRNRELVFEDYVLRFPEIAFIYRAGGIRYESTVTLDLPPDVLSLLNREEHHPLFVNLGLSFAAGHFFLGDFATLRCDCARLEQRDCRLLEGVLQEALGECRYLLGLDPSRPVRVVSSGNVPLRPLPFPRAQNEALLLNGGGKDSCVAAELLKGAGLPFSWMVAYSNEPRTRVIERSGNHECHIIRFELSDDVRRDAVYPWGANPYLYTIAAAGLIVAYLEGYTYMVTGMEHSADDPNLVYKGVGVNHQAGKTSAFENFFNEFVHRSVLEEAKLFSIVRPFTDLRLAEMFSHYRQYFDAFFSCNMGMGTGTWCKACYKCAFTYMALYPFMERQELAGIFGGQLFDIALMRRYMIELATAPIKPWDCVGTREESRLALHYCLKKSPDMDFGEWPRRRDLEKACEDINEQAACRDIMYTFHTPHNIPGCVEQYLRDEAGTSLHKTRQRWPGLVQS